MTDILVKLYALDTTPTDLPGVVIRRPLPHEKGVVKRWVEEAFSAGWAEEFECGFKSFPVTSLIALSGGAIVGFACYDVTSRGFFGPTGVADEARGKGIGRELLMRSMAGLRELGYAYAIVGGAGPVEFYVKTLGGIPIPGSSPGIYPGRITVTAGPAHSPPPSLRSGAPESD